MIPHLAFVLVTAASSFQPARADEVARPFVAICEDLGRLCRAEAYGRNQIRAEQACHAACPSAVIISVKPAAGERATPIDRKAARRAMPPHARL